MPKKVIGQQAGTVTNASDQERLSPSRRQEFAVRALGVLAGWYLALAALVAMVVLLLPDESRADASCVTFGCGFSTRDFALLVLLLYGPVALAVSLVVSLLVFIVMLVARVRRPAVIGTAAGGVPVVAIVFIIAVLLSALHESGQQPDAEATPDVRQCIAISGGRGCPGG